MTPSTPPGDFELVEEYVRDSPQDGELHEVYAALARLCEREKVQAGKLSATIRRAEAAEHDLALERSLNESYKLANEQHQARVKEAEEALREVDRVAGEGKIGDIARRALAHEEEAP